MPNVYAWPPVAHVAAEWTMIAPIGRSRSILTGASYVSAVQRRRRVAKLQVSYLSLDRNGSGYIEVLKRLLDGGVHLVRLHSTPIIWHLDDLAQNAGRTKPMSWIVPPGGISWMQPPGAIEWWTGPGVTAGVAGAGNTVTVSGLPASQLVARPGEFVTMNGATAMVLKPARSNAAGVAVLHLVTPLSGSGPIEIGARETGVFEADDMPRAVQPFGANWSYTWTFTEVFADERGPFNEVDPWS